MSAVANSPGSSPGGPNSGASTPGGTSQGGKRSPADISILVDPIEEISRKFDPITASLNEVKNAVTEKRSKRQKLFRALKMVTVVVSVLWAYEQYLQHNVETQRANAEQDFTWATTQLNSGSPAVRAAAVRTAYQLAFRDTPVEPNGTVVAPAINLFHWVLNRREYTFFNPIRDLLQEYAQSERPTEKAGPDEVSSALFEVAADWRKREGDIFGRTMNDSGLWLLSQARLPRGRAPSLDLSHFQLVNADLSFADLQYSHMTGANLQGATLQGFICEGCTLPHATLLDVKTNGVAARFNFAELQYVSARRANLTGSDFSNANLSEAHFESATLDRATFKTATLRKTSFQKATLIGADFSGADVSGADFSGAILDGADFQFAANLDRVASWNGASIRDTKFPNTFTTQR